MEELEDTRDSELQEHFEEYERLLEIDDAERAWDGYGDLMHNSMRRANLNLDMLGPQILFSIGAAAQTEKQFFELLSLHSIGILYDFRPTDYRDEVRCQQPHFEIRILKSYCRQRHIHYRHVAVGRETAYGTLKHLQSDEVQHILVELVWQAKHGGRTAFLGLEEDWRADGRVALAEERTKAEAATKIRRMQPNNKGLNPPALWKKISSYHTCICIDIKKRHTSLTSMQENAPH